MKRRTYTKEQLVEAVARAQNGETAYKLGKAFGKPVNTIVNRAKGVNGDKLGRPTVFSEEQERILADAIVNLAV